MKKILFTDLDGTLLGSDKLVSEGNRAAIQRLLDAGHYLVVATGRPVKSGFKVVKSLGLTMPGCYMIAYNGGAILDCAKEELCMAHSVPLEDAKYLFDEARKYGIYIQTYGKDDTIFAEQDCEELQSYLKGNRHALDYKVCDNVCEVIGCNPAKVLLVCNDREKLEKFQRDHEEWAKEHCDTTFSTREFLEYLPKNVNKGMGVTCLCEMLGIPLEYAYAAGDEENDISMIKAAGVGIAMQNAIDEVKMVADYITEHDHNHDGIAEVIDRLIL